MAKTHYEAISHKNDGCGFVLVSSTLTGRLWDGAVWVFSSYEDFINCPNLDMVATRTATGISDVLWLSSQKDLVLACDSGELEVWTCGSPGNTLTLATSVGCHDDMVLAVKQLQESQSLVSGGADGKVIVWDIEAVELVKSYKAHCGPVLSVSSHPSSSPCFMSTGQDGVVLTWDLRLPKPVTKFAANHSVVYTTSTMEHNTLALGSEAGSVEVYDLRGDPINYATYSAHKRPIRRLTFAPWNTSLLASVSDDQTVAMKVLTHDNSMVTNHTHQDFVRGASWDCTDHTLLTCGWDGQLVKHTLEQLGDTSEQNAFMSCDKPYKYGNGSHDFIAGNQPPRKGQEPIDMFADEVNLEVEQ